MMAIDLFTGTGGMSLGAATASIKVALAVEADQSIRFVADMRAEYFTRFEDCDVLEQFCVKFRPRGR